MLYGQVATCPIPLSTNKIKFDRQSLDRQWKIKQEKHSPCYTTRINDIISINV
ncbi:DUF4113 domain-containing protein [Flavobacterium sp. TSSA_36]|uniref:DUF4113 domain-containing protein n=1 Tax=Flavobacterium sp. TSSA_36 TaxID=3447669 RepID=UPI003F2F6A87